MTLRHILLAVAALAGCTMASAGMDIDEYMPPSELIELDEEQARQQRERVRREAEQARIEAERQERLEQAEREQIEAERAARPLAVRLIEQRCLGCHALELVTLKPRTRLGWEWVVLRMRWFNGAALEPGEHSVISTHLTQRHPAPGRRAIIELVVIAIAIAIGAGITWRTANAWLARRKGTREWRK